MEFQSLKNMPYKQFEEKYMEKNCTVPQMVQ